MSTPATPVRCEALVLRNGFWTGNRCSRNATTEVNGHDLCAQHAKAVNDGKALDTSKPVTWIATR